MSTFSIGVVLADDHPGMIAGVVHELASVNTIELRGHVSNSTELVELLESTPCDVLVSDYAMPTGKYGDGITLFGFITRRFPDLKLVVLTMLDNPAILGSLDDIGVRAIVSKSDAVAHLIPAIHAAYTGGKYHSPTVVAVLKERTAQRANAEAPPALSPREMEVVRLFVSGMRVDDIAERLNRSKKTISTQKARAMEKLGFTSDTDLVKYAVEHGWLASSLGVPRDAD
ncbi:MULTISPECIES: LuxR C-terminal-related transcriptional regulator [Burkholderia cepacia complex]|uniref:LuxR C-terminal-related transcriptional regulator n=1 Tax=Burkholderia cepacia complex TaxID=87882 RepID=UPI001B9B5991|nr:MULTISPECIES: LuxR C-terminal-related transcriptional regulator [Burkholderia cepacia complex]MBR8402683.1 response regulator [Burkholderia cenocepacia]MDN7643676.1 LuxR C-terminal-related transcriptional regulator [Burkholderia cenocepacia]WJN72854.1 Two-component transcriptional response regulator, LuxR family [Burkholderia anthina]